MVSKANPSIQVELVVANETVIDHEAVSPKDAALESADLNIKVLSSWLRVHFLLGMYSYFSGSCTTHRRREAAERNHTG